MRKIYLLVASAWSILCFIKACFVTDYSCLLFTSCCIITVGCIILVSSNENDSFYKIFQ